MFQSATCATIVLVLILGSWADHRGYLFFHYFDHSRRYEGRRFEVVGVAGVDTIEVAHAAGRMPARKRESMSVRLWGVEAPRTPELRRVIEGLCLGKTVRLSVPPHRLRDASRRLLAYVWLPDRIMLNEHLLAAGLVRADDAVRHQWFARFALLAKQARMDGVGLWAEQVNEARKPDRRFEVLPR